MSTKIKLVHIISSMHQGGAENLLLQLIDSLGSEAYEHHLIYFHDGPCRLRVDSRVHLYHITGRVCLYDPVWWYRLWSLVKSLQPTLMHTHLWAAHVAGRVMSRFLSIPLIATYHTPLLEDDSYIRKQIDALTMHHERFSCAVSTTVASTWKPLARSAARMNWQLVTNGIDIAAFDQRALHERLSRAQLGIPEGAFVYGSVGRFIPSKRFDLLIEAFCIVSASYPSTYLVLVGWGEQEQALRDQVREQKLEDRVIFVVGKSAAAYYKLMDVFVSSSEREGMSIALLEALASSCPVIVVNQSRLPHDVVTNGKEGVLLFSNLPTTVAGAMIHMLLFPDNIAHYKQEARATVERSFSIERMTRQYEQLYSRIINDI